MPLVKDPDNIRIAMLGMNEGNGHPFSWSAIINGRYNAQEMENCGYPVIPQYLGAQPPEALGIPGAQVTHVHCDRREDAEHVARCSYVENIMDRPEDAIGQVDAVIIGTDIGGEHLRRAQPFIDNNVPLFIDKPMTDELEHLNQFIRWHDQGKPFLSSSSLRYSPNLAEARQRMNEVGQPRYITMSMANTWARYGMHALEAVYPFLPPGGWVDVVNTGQGAFNHVHMRHQSGVEALLSVVKDLKGASGHLQVYGTEGRLDAKSGDAFNSFKNQLVDFVQYLRTAQPPYPFEQTIELAMLLIAGRLSQEQGGRRIRLDELAVEKHPQTA